MVLLEAMSCSLPVISVDLSVIHEVLEKKYRCIWLVDAQRKGERWKHGEFWELLFPYIMPEDIYGSALKVC